MVEVEFPEDPRMVESRPRYQESREIGADRQRVYLGEEPLFDPEWRFVQVIGSKWIARPR